MMPVGSIIMLDPGYQYRINYWKDLFSLPSDNNITLNLSISEVIIDEAWWDDYHYVAFNISTKGTLTDISSSVSEVKNHFRIYVPKDNLPDNQTQYDEDYTELNFDWTLGYWSSTGNNPHEVVTTESNSKNYITQTIKISKDKLPVGSIILINYGFQYQINYWKSLNSLPEENKKLSKQSNRLIEINETWWGEYNYITFNLSSVYGDIDMTNVVDQVVDQFHIYVLN